MRRAIGRPALLPDPRLLPPVVTPFGPADSPACRADGVDPDAFFDDDRVDEAKSVCAGCPALARCLAYAIGSEEYGVWGGMTPQERDDARGGPLPGTPEERFIVFEIRRRIDAGDSVGEVAAYAGVTERTMHRWLAAARAAELDAAA